MMRPVIIGLSGVTLTESEARLLQHWRPLGVILFRRNIETPSQLTGLIAAIRGILPEARLMLDQEGGRVARLRPPHWRAYKPAAAHATAREAWLTGALIGLEARQAGFDIVTAPVLDVASPQGHDVIGDRSFGGDPRLVAERGAAMAQGLLAAGIEPVAKHVPGHGSARADSHLTLPELDDITDADLLPFYANRWIPWFMTAHIRYRSRDMQNPATQSATIIEDVIRSPAKLGFEGVLTSDDLAMEALTGPPGERARLAIAAGCDVALHCSGVLAETEAVLRAVPPPGGATLKRLSTARKLAARLRDPSLDAGKLLAERDALPA
jgi:beta-N-acetylhexosaminidase